MKVLNVIRTEENLKDKNSDSYLAAIQKRAEKEGVEVKVIHELPLVGYGSECNSVRIANFCNLNPNTIVLEPCEYFFDRKYTLDKNLTARAIFNLIQEQGEKLIVTVINRTDLIGNPLYRMLRDANYTPMQCHSQTTKEGFNLSTCADIIVTATGNDMSELFRYKDKTKIIDVSNDIRKYDVEYRLADQKEIGKRTLDLLFKELNKYYDEC